MAEIVEEVLEDQQEEVQIRDAFGRPITESPQDQKEERKTPKEEVTCSFCGGSGKDPFGIMSSLSTCCVCGGRGVVEVETPHVRCAHCEGTGAIKRLTCTACRGTGFVPAPEGPTAVCPKCKGTGDDVSDWAIPCLNCRGRGWVSL